ncbi:hypothetical protein [Streptomyces sp. NPDC005302]|uniref:hypothetical protein n=1 Tax=Streptomyces sp. NPDC005302 TaxID=3154675 RepID=UPI0033AF4FAC
MAAIGSLLFTGIATYYSAVIARQQLDQAREDSENDARSQAARITFWMEEGSMTEGRAVHLVNRSPDAVTDADILLGTTYKGGEYELRLPSSGIPPCTEAIFKSAEMSALITSNAIGEVDLADFTWWEADLLAFTDRAGQKWVRTATSLQAPEEARKNLLETKTDGLVLAAEPSNTAALKECGSDR